MSVNLRCSFLSLCHWSPLPTLWLPLSSRMSCIIHFFGFCTVFHLPYISEIHLCYLVYHYYQVVFLYMGTHMSFIHSILLMDLTPNICSLVGTYYQFFHGSASFSYTLALAMISHFLWKFLLKSIYAIKLLGSVSMSTLLDLWIKMMEGKND
jgi:hypothetical protein